MDKILIVDDNLDVCQALSLMLELSGYKSHCVQSPQAALDAIAAQEFALVIQDMNFTRDTTSGEEGRELFHGIRALRPDIPIILLTAWTELETAVELMKAGAADYLGKPWDDAKLLTSIGNLVSLHRLSRENGEFRRQQAVRSSVFAKANLCGLVFGSPAMERCVDLALQLAKSDVSVLITGPNGAGKDRLADILHANSPLKDKPFIKVNVGALPLELMEAELFGAEAGAFTGATKARIGRFEAADGGTLFLDEIGNLPLPGQIKLLRVLQTGEFERLGSHQTRKCRVRVLSATNANLRQDIIDGRFREDLFYRLNVVELALPPLAERKDDILPLVRHFIPERELAADAQRALLAHHWPGNVRELENACKRASILSRGNLLTAADFGLVSEPLTGAEPESMRSATNSATNFATYSASSSVENLVDNSVESSGAHTASLASREVEAASVTQPEPGRAEIEQALALHRGVIARVAKSFGLSRQALYRRMEKFGIEGKASKESES